MANAPELVGKNVLVIGGGTGMGKAIALQLCKDGANLAVAGRREEKLTEVVIESDQKIKSHIVDVTDRASVSNLFTWFEDKMGELDILVHAAGINIANRAMEQLEPDEWDKVIQINLTGAYNCLQATLLK